MKSYTEILKAELSSKSLAAQTLIKADHDAVKHQLDMRSELLHAGMTLEQDATAQQQDMAHQAGLQAQTQDHQRTLAEQQRQHEQELAAMPPPAAPASQA